MFIFGKNRIDERGAADWKSNAVVTIHDPVTGRLMLDLGLERGIGFGAHFIEVYAEDCDDPLSAAVLMAAATQLISG